MLSKEAAEKRLADWKLSAEGNVDRFLVEAKKLPKSQKSIAMAILGYDEKGVEIDDWEMKNKNRLQAAVELERLSAKDRTRIFRLFFPRFADWVEAAWQLLKTTPYQIGYRRKSFRAPGDPSVTLESRIQWLQTLQSRLVNYREQDVTLSWLAQWTPYAFDYGASVVGPLLAALIESDDKEGREVFEILRQSVTNEHEIGSMGSHVVKSLLMSSREEGWELMEKTLLAAQRQEGLRQSILDAVDESHPIAFRRMLRLIAEHDLARFSAVTRAVNVWLGLMWDSVSVKVINDIIKQTLHFLDDPAAGLKGLQSDNPDTVFRALWCIGFDDAHASIPHAAKLLAHKSDEIRFVAAWYLGLLDIKAANQAKAPAIDDPNLQVALCALKQSAGLSVGEDFEALVAGNDDEQEQSTDGFEAAERLYLRLPEKPFKLKALVWPWTERNADRSTVAAALLGLLGERPVTRIIPYLKGMDSWQQMNAVRLLAQQKKWDKLTRETLFSLTGHASQNVRQAAFESLIQQVPTGDEAVALEGLMTRKASDLRQSGIKLLLKQEDSAALATADRLTGSRDAPQRLAGLEILRHLSEANRERQQCQQKAITFVETRKNLSKEEQTQISAIGESDQEAITLENGLGLMDPTKRSPVIAPKRRPGESFTPAALKCLQGLDELIHQHRETPIRIKAYDGPRQELLGNVTHWFPSFDRTKGTPETEIRHLPLNDVWTDWYKNRPKSLRDRDGLELLRAYCTSELVGHWDYDEIQKWSRSSAQAKSICREVIGDVSGLKLKYESLVSKLLEWLLFLYPPEGFVDWMLDRIETTYSLVPDDLHSELVKPSEKLVSSDNMRQFRIMIGQETDDDWRQWQLFEYWRDDLNAALLICRKDLTPKQLQRFWSLEHWRDEPRPGAKRDRPEFRWVAESRKLGFATSDDLMDQLIGPRDIEQYGSTFPDLANLTQRTMDDDRAKEIRDLPEITEMLDRIRARVLEIELTRGEAATPATILALSIQSFFGMSTLFRVLSAIDKAKLKKGSSWRQNNASRGSTLTHLLQSTYPLESDKQAEFDKLVSQAIKEGYCTGQRLLELAFLAPQWTRFVESYLNWKGFAEGLYWFVAHMDTGWNSSVESAAAEAEGIQEEKVDSSKDVTADDDLDDAEDHAAETTVTRRTLTPWQRLLLERTALTDEERTQGAVDVAWFHRTWELLGSDRWHQMADAARYAANPAQAKKAQFLADVLLGNTPKQDLVDSIQQKQRKEHVRLLGLLPLAKGTKQDRDILERYEVLQEYRRYARQLSGLTRPSAMRACDIGFDNLARLAGYPDPLRFEWAMEAEAVKDLAKGPVAVTKDGVTVTLFLDEQAKPELTIQRENKTLKSVPPAIKKKHAEIAELFERGAALRKKASRMKQSLEAAMCRGDRFTGAEMETLSEHAILAPLLTRLVLVDDADQKRMGYLDKRGKSLRDHAGTIIPIKKGDHFRIAHPADLLKRKDWDRWQHECFTTERMQPFKQVFRELYVVTKQEQSDGAASQRYAGQQINPTQGFALWNSRGWNTQDDVFKTFHDVGITASVGFQYNAGTAAEVEGLTLSGIRFAHRDKKEPPPLNEVPVRIFSEVMRDIDLVVSVAHRGGVDPEASASTVEMRTALLRETTELLGLKNVRIKGVHALIKGRLGEYSVHLGSAIVHRMPGGSICIIPVHAQHRGRLFLPFADDDPRTAELISKVLLLAKDHEIQDPSILDQLR